jgi:hypothetical protein
MPWFVKHGPERLALGFIIAALAIGACRPPASAQSAPARIAALKTLGITVYYPRYVPRRFALVSVARTRDKGVWWVRPSRPRSNYTLNYCDARKNCVRIFSVSWLDETGCLGKTVRALPAPSRSFPTMHVCAERRPPDTYAAFESDAAMTAWMRSDSARPASKRSRTGPPASLRFYELDAGGVTDREAIAIAVSLTPVR